MQIYFEIKILIECNYKCLSCEDSSENCIECADENREMSACDCKIGYFE